MIFNSLCGIAKNKIEEEKKNYPYILIQNTSFYSSTQYAEKPELCEEQLVGVRFSKLEEKDIKEGIYTVPIFLKGKFINTFGVTINNIFSSSVKDLSLTKLIVPEGIISITGDFEYLNQYTNVSNIVLPSTMKYVQAYSLEKTKDFLSIDVSKLYNCIYFGKYSFYKSKMEYDFEFNPNTKYIGYGAFENSNFNGVNGIVTIPINIIEIYPHVFGWCDNLKEVVLHKEVNKIGQYAFAYCTNLGENKTLDLLNVKEIGYYAFAQTKFEDFIINYDIIEKIDQYALATISNFSIFKTKKEGDFKITNKMKILGSYWWCNNTLIDDVKFAYYTYNKNHDSFKDYENDCILDLTEATALEEIGDNSFSGFHKIKGSLFPPNIKKIGERAYQRGVNYGKSRSTDSIECVAYDSLPDSLEILEDYWLTGFDIPMTLTTVCTENSHLQRLGHNVFNNYTVGYSSSDYRYLAFCNRMTILSETVILPSSLLSLGDNVFHSQKNIKHFKVKGDGTQNVLEFCDGHGSGSGIAQFENATNLVTIDFSERTIKTIPVAIAHNCGYLTEFSYEGKIYNINDLAFANTSLSSFEFKEGLEYIGGGAFAKGSISKGEILKNQDIIFPTTLQKIRPAAFHTCSMKSITFNEGLKEIHFDAFEKCTNVTNELVFPSTLEYIGSFAFNHYQNCSNTSITIPASVRIIGEGGDPTHTAYREYNSGSHNFYNCASRYNKEFIVEEDNQWFTAIDGVLFGKDTEGNVIRLISLPRQLKQKNNSPIVNGIYTIPEGITIMDELCFNYCVGVNELILPNSYIISATLPKSTKKLYGDSFYYANDIYTSYINTNGNTLSVAIYTWHTLQNVTCKEDNPNYKSINGMVYSKDGKSLWYLSDCKTGDIAIAEGTERIEHGALYTQNKSRIKATSLTIPASVTYIDSACLNYLNNYYIASGVCTVNIDSANTTYGIVDNKVTKL